MFVILGIVEQRVRKESVSQVPIHWEGLGMKQVVIVQEEGYATMIQGCVNVLEVSMEVDANIIAY